MMGMGRNERNAMNGNGLGQTPCPFHLLELESHVQCAACLDCCGFAVSQFEIFVLLFEFTFSFSAWSLIPTIQPPIRHG